MVGIGCPKTMKMEGELRGRKVLVLIGSGATHNFLSEKLLEELKIPMKAAQFAMVLGDDHRVKGVGKCEGVTITLQGITITQNFLPFRLGGFDNRN